MSQTSVETNTVLLRVQFVERESYRPDELAQLLHGLGPLLNVPEETHEDPRDFLSALREPVGLRERVRRWIQYWDPRPVVLTPTILEPTDVAVVAVSYHSPLEILLGISGSMALVRSFIALVERAAAARANAAASGNEYRRKVIERIMLERAREHIERQAPGVNVSEERLLAAAQVLAEIDEAKLEEG